jgi:peroxin-2
MSDVAPTAWQRAWDNAQPRLAAINETISSYESPTSRVLRVGQLDAELLDAELVQILREPIAKSLSLIHVSGCWPSKYSGAHYCCFTT